MIVNSWTGIPSPPLAFFILMLSKAHLTSYSRISGSRWGQEQQPRDSTGAAERSYCTPKLRDNIWSFCPILSSPQFSRSVIVWLFATLWTTAHQVSLSITNTRSPLRLMSTESAMPSSHLILCHPLLFLPPTPPSIRVISNETTLRMRWPKYWSFSLRISPSNEHPGLVTDI